MQTSHFAAFILALGWWAQASAADPIPEPIPAFAAGDRILFQGDSINAGHQILADAWEAALRAADE